MDKVSTGLTEWAYTLCGNLLPAGFVFNLKGERHRVTCANCKRAKAFNE